MRRVAGGDRSAPGRRGRSIAPFRGWWAAACSQANAHLHEQVLGGIRASGWLRELDWRRRHEVARARIRTAGGSPPNERPFPSLHSRASAGCARPGTTSPATGRGLTTRNPRHAPRRRTDRATWRAGHDVDEEQLAQESLSPIGPTRHRRGPGSAPLPRSGRGSKGIEFRRRHRVRHRSPLVPAAVYLGPDPGPGRRRRGGGQGFPSPPHLSGERAEAGIFCRPRERGGRLLASQRPPP